MGIGRSECGEDERQSSARRRALLFRGFASASSTHGRPHSLLPRGPVFSTAAHAAHRPASLLPRFAPVAAAPMERSFYGTRPVTRSAGGDGGAGGGASNAPSAAAAGSKLYPDPPFKGMGSAFKPLSLAITVVKCYGLSFGNLMFGAEMEEQAITDEQINSAHKASLELVLRELATTTLRRVLEKLAIVLLERRWANKLLKDVGASARRKAVRDGNFYAAARIALTSLRSSLLVHIATWTVEALIDVIAMLRGKLKPAACARTVLHRALNRLICALAAAAGASLLTLVFPGMGTFIGALLAESAAPYLTAMLLGDVHQYIL
ncbi:hypothetical protein T492DRAFT_944861, partial [Pavlovales sp. CCMP2436]